MTPMFLICSDPDENENRRIDKDQQIWANDEYELDKYLPQFARTWPQSTLCVFRLHEIQKLKTMPTYQKYRLNENGEIIPV